MDTELVVICSHPPYSIYTEHVPVHSPIFCSYRNGSHLFTGPIFSIYIELVIICSQPPYSIETDLVVICSQPQYSMNTELISVLNFHIYIKKRKYLCNASAFCKDRTGKKCTQLKLSINIKMLLSVHIPTFYQYRSVSICPNPHFLSVQKCRYLSTFPLSISTEVSVSVHIPTFYQYRSVSICPNTPLSSSIKVSVSVLLPTFYQYRSDSIGSHTPLYIDTELVLSSNSLISI
jgi:hypothetical protein